MSEKHVSMINTVIGEERHGVLYCGSVWVVIYLAACRVTSDINPGSTSIGACAPERQDAMKRVPTRALVGNFVAASE